MKKSVIVLLIFVLLLGAASYVYFFVYNKEHPEYAKLEPDFTLEARALYDEFSANSEQSSKKYNGKMILITGTPDRIEQVDSLVIAVFAFNEGMFGAEGMRCTFLPGVAQGINGLDDLQDKQIKGYCTGFNDIDVILENCSLTK